MVSTYNTRTQIPEIACQYPSVPSISPCKRCNLQAAYSYLLGQIGDAVEVMPGEEFRVALQEASKVLQMSVGCHAVSPVLRVA